jgi:maltose O-acetyltransferase
VSTSSVGRCGIHDSPLSVRTSSLVPLQERVVGSFSARALRAIHSEIGALHPRLLLATLPASLLPPLAFPRVRTALYRLGGVSIGAHTLLAGRLELIGPGAIAERLRIGHSCFLNAPIFIDLTGRVTIGDRVTLGHHVVLVTASHRVGPRGARAGPVQSAPIVIGDGVWIAAGVTILPGVTVGAGSIVGAGSVVTHDIPERTLAFGTPARPVRQLGPDADLDTQEEFSWVDPSAPDEPIFEPALHGSQH